MIINYQLLRDLVMIQHLIQNILHNDDLRKKETKLSYQMLKVKCLLKPSEEILHSPE